MKALFLSIFIFFSLSNVHAKLIEKTEAIVDGQAILKSEVTDFRGRIGQQNLVNQNLIDLYGLTKSPKYPKLLDYLIVKKMLILNSTKEKNGVSLEDLAEKEIKNLAEQNGISVTQLKDEIQGRNINYYTYRNFIGESSLIRDTIERNVISQVRPTEDDFVSYLKRQGITDIRSSFTLNLDQIFISKSLEKELKLAQKIDSENYKNYFNNPKEFKIDTLSLGSLKFRDLSSKHQKYLKGLEEGQISQPIEEPNGYRIFYVNSKTTSYNIPNSPLVQKKQKEFYDSLIQKRFKNWIANLKNDFFIRVNSKNG